jgi:hypothetical protein
MVYFRSFVIQGREYNFVGIALVINFRVLCLYSRRHKVAASCSDLDLRTRFE